jgi:hypothetical protein
MAGIAATATMASIATNIINFLNFSTSFFLLVIARIYHTHE